MSILTPNEDGVLVAAPAVSANERVLQLAANTGGSGQGMSHYSQASRCGRRARLSAERYKSFADASAPLPMSKNHFVIGSVYHKLHELARRPRQDVALDYNEQFQNPNVAEGARLYKGWLRHWGLDYWGDCLAVECHFEDDDTFVGDAVEPTIVVTGALDMVVEMDAAACERAARRGIQLDPGRRIVDWKTADSPSDGVNYAQGLQALWYPYLWNKFNPQAPVDGIIFDVVMKRSRRKDRTVQSDDFQAFYVPYGLESIDTLRGMVEQGHRNVELDTPNRSECCDWKGNVCPFRTYGTCDAT